jgi:hypothetical protein
VAQAGENDSSIPTTKPLSVMWNALNNHQRLPFIQLADEDRDRATEERLQEQEIRAMMGM